MTDDGDCPCDDGCAHCGALDDLHRDRGGRVWLCGACIEVDEQERAEAAMDAQLAREESAA